MKGCWRHASNSDVKLSGVREAKGYTVGNEGMWIPAKEHGKGGQQGGVCDLEMKASSGTFLGCDWYKPEQLTAATGFREGETPTLGMSPSRLVLGQQLLLRSSQDSSRTLKLHDTLKHLPASCSWPCEPHLSKGSRAAGTAIARTRATRSKCSRKRVSRNDKLDETKS